MCLETWQVAPWMAPPILWNFLVAPKLLNSPPSVSTTKTPSSSVGWNYDCSPEIWEQTLNQNTPKKTPRNIHPPRCRNPLHWVSVPGGRAPPYSRQKKKTKAKELSTVPFFWEGSLLICFFFKIMLPFPKLFWWRFGFIMGKKLPRNRGNQSEF